MVWLAGVSALRPTTAGAGIAQGADTGQAATRPMVKFPGHALVPAAPQTLRTVICAQGPYCVPVASSGQAKSVTSPLPTSAAPNVSVATPPAFTGWAQLTAGAPGAAGAREGQSTEAPAAAALRNSIFATPLPGAPATVALSVIGPALRGTHMQGWPPHAVPDPIGVPPSVTPMPDAVAVGTAVMLAVSCLVSKWAALAPPLPRLGRNCSSRAVSSIAIVAPVAGTGMVPVQIVGEVSAGPES